MAFRRSIYKTPAQLRAMVEPGLITAAALEALRPAVVAGATTAEIDAIAYDTIVARGAESNFKLVRGYRHTTCISVNEQVVHGIPGERVLNNGDLVTFDCGAYILDEDGTQWHGDAAFTDTLPGGKYAVATHRGPFDGLMDTTEELLSWASDQGLQWDSTATDNGEEWAGRIEIYETGPATEPDPANWVTVLAFKLAD